MGRGGDTLAQGNGPFVAFSNKSLQKIGFLQGFAFICIFWYKTQTISDYE